MPITSDLDRSLLDADEPPSVIIDVAGGSSPLVIVCDHAGRLIPRQLKNLGLPAEELERHIAWDIGADDVARLVSADIDAVCVRQCYSRLVIDCNRSPGHPQSIIPLSEKTLIPGNENPAAAEIDRRVKEIFLPYHNAIASILDRRHAVGRLSTLVAVHSFTPVYDSVARPWQAGVLYDGNPAFALLVQRLLKDEGIVVGDNEPYRLSAESDYTITTHATARHLPYVELEIRQDLIASPIGQRDWASLLSRILPKASMLLSTKQC